MQASFIWDHAQRWMTARTYHGCVCPHQGWFHGLPAVSVVVMVVAMKWLLLQGGCALTRLSCTFWCLVHLSAMRRTPSTAGVSAPRLVFSALTCRGMCVYVYGKHGTLLCTAADIQYTARYAYGTRTAHGVLRVYLGQGRCMCTSLLTWPCKASRACMPRLAQWRISSTAGLHPAASGLKLSHTCQQ